MNIGNKLKTIRKKCLLSQVDFAKEINVSFSTVNRWENDKNIPNYQALKKIKDFCDKKGIPFEIDDEI
ncbi:helix-turn-helix domain-containing protein [Megamonas hypermegale]|uniref:helix-turn-helix domain-containing protein n=1 Tax=Megamonas hypermegale TaxID=158847 RepID=UPI00195C1D47|nr:helix-turn-helix transcriptional regulator [Megamonas hypermegale]MBM6761013.1 helix-turn-helix transcriptional regulator [Megamonas hypermegale]